MNNFSLDGEVVYLEKIRFTPAGLSVLRSRQKEASLSKIVNLEIESVVIGELTQEILTVGDRYLFHGFIEKKSLKSNQNIFHITQIKKI